LRAAVDCSRHGVGVSFEAPGRMIDVHVGLATFDDAIDGWRSLQYLESRNVTCLMFEGEAVDARDEGALERLLEAMAQARIMEIVLLGEPPRRLFRPATIGRGGAVMGERDT